jgi:hypothetical protein
MLPASSAASSGLATLDGAETSFPNHNTSTTNCFARMDSQGGAGYRFSRYIDEMTLFHYREEDQFREKTNSMRLRELYDARDLNGLFELALLMNHEACYANSKVRWAISEALEVTMPVSDKHVEMADEIIQMLVDKKLKMAKENKKSEETEENII